MKRIILCLSFFAFFGSQAQQINPVPDYVFRNQMSVGRNAATDTAAYFSVGPRFGATKGMMPPMVVDTATFSGSKRNGLLIFSVQKNKYLYWDSVRVQWSDMAGSSGQYITGTLTTRYIPKASSSTVITNSVMYDSSSHVRVYGNWIGNTNSNRFLFQTEVDGSNGYGLKVQQNDSLDNNIQYVMSLRKGLLTSSKPRPGFGAGYDVRLPDDTGAFRRVGSILHRLSDTTASGISSYMQFQVARNGNMVNPMQISSDSSIRMAKLAGSGTRYVVADANGDLTATSTTALVDTFLISTRAWRQKAVDSINSNVALKVNISDTASMLTPYLRKIDTATMLNPYLRKIDTSAMLSAYIRAAGYGLTKSGQSLLVDTAAMATRARVQKGIDSLGAAKQNVLTNPVTGTGTTNYVAKFTGTSAIGNSSIFDNGNVAIGSNSPLFIGNYKTLLIQGGSTSQGGLIQLQNSDATVKSYWFTTESSSYLKTVTNHQLIFGVNNTDYLYLNTNGELQIGSSSDLGAYTLQNTGAFYNTGSAILAATSGNVGVGTATPASKLTVSSGAVESTNGTIRAAITYANNGGANDVGVLGTLSNHHIAFMPNDVEKMRLKTDGELLLGSSTDQGTYVLQVTGAIYGSSTIITGAPAGGTAKPFKIGAAASVSPTSPNRTIEIEIDGTTYYIHAKTTND